VSRVWVSVFGVGCIGFRVEGIGLRGLGLGDEGRPAATYASPIVSILNSPCGRDHTVSDTPPDGRDHGVIHTFYGRDTTIETGRGMRHRVKPTVQGRDTESDPLPGTTLGRDSLSGATNPHVTTKLMATRPLIYLDRPPEKQWLSRHITGLKTWI